MASLTKLRIVSPTDDLNRIAAMQGLGWGFNCATLQLDPSAAVASGLSHQ